MPATSIPRAAMSVATRILNSPRLKPLKACRRFYWERLPCNEVAAHLADTVKAAMKPAWSDLTVPVSFYICLLQIQRQVIIL